MEQVTKDQIIMINVLFSQIATNRGFKIEKEEKAALMASYSGDRSESTTGLYIGEARLLIKDLKKQLGEPTEKLGDKMKRHIIAMAHEMNWHKIHPVGTKPSIDIKRIDAWCKQFGYLHKPLDDYDYFELPMLVTQFKKYYRSYLKSI